MDETGYFLECTHNFHPKHWDRYQNQCPIQAFNRFLAHKLLTPDYQITKGGV